ncbi:response regulator [Methylobacter tundripaludum]|uniref:Response regulator receiver protein n=1 Tax=Methylobacter tundripaludum (strain ATCC BAA-1195 / DSM 17260 / SV96) TaxID=697282 RepID=G3IWW5_METTV|nr:response regulator [Methylobacter tundripaludum]EGW23320.1 response regulator receiver protein [Methylobacter tundripaludum SV96]
MAKTILVVDDSALIRTSVTQHLKNGGFTVETADDGLNALNMLKAGLKPDLMITDINMPNMNGIELIQSTRALPEFRFMPILVMTTESQQTMRDEAKQLGATGWVVKPVGGELLMSIIKKVLPGA